MSFFSRFLSTNDPFRYLEEDHRKVEALFDRLDSTMESAVKTRVELFNQLSEALTLHATTEEEAVYPVLKALDDAHDLATEAVEEHAVVKRLLAELATTPPDTEQWTAKLKVLQENVKHHVKEEEGQLFKLGRRELEEGQKEMMLTEMERVRHREMAKA